MQYGFADKSSEKISLPTEPVNLIAGNATDVYACFNLAKGSIYLKDAETESIVKEFIIDDFGKKDSYSTFLGFSPRDSKLIFSVKGYVGNLTKVFDIKSGSIVNQRNEGFDYISPDQTKGISVNFVSPSKDAERKVTRTYLQMGNTWQRKFSFTVPKRAFSVSKDLRYVVGVGQQGEVQIWNTDDTWKMHNLLHEQLAYTLGVAITPDNKFLAIAKGHNPSKVCFYDIASLPEGLIMPSLDDYKSHEVAFEVEVDGKPEVITFDARNGRMAVGGQDGGYNPTQGFLNVFSTDSFKSVEDSKCSIQ